MTRTICVLTGSRAEYGLLRSVMSGIAEAVDLRLQVLVTGMHLSPEFGLTYREIEADGFHIDRKVEMLLSADTPTAISKSIGLGMIGMADALNELRPDILVILGDRFESLAAATAALVARIPVAHIHGGETTEGAIDESIRHAITKMSHLHFVAADEYRRRVIQLGEAPDRVFLVGGLGVDNLLRIEPLTREELEHDLGFRFRARNLMVTFHPATLDGDDPEVQLAELLAVLETLPETGLIFTMPNADTDGRGIIRAIERFVASHNNAKAFTSLGQLRYVSCLHWVDGVVGNSSSGLLEAPSLRTPTVNVGSRQGGRLKATSVIDCEPRRDAIANAISTMYSPRFQRQLQSATNPYGDGGASERVVTTLRSAPLGAIVKKTFYDLPVTE